ncbi:hypothetical protein EW145_g7177 [Phellinidium pouzarii]|uniref:Major facilitator superfamily (MFS) profile domain-containing protein n=1 Tax=Phellinidium pouzarii TaxID=167371 RepID=A0A4S4KMX7_9AGAM|nr:hypothetical protein EW145_g7177 [Phellinidium pouzarii]
MMEDIGVSEQDLLSVHQHHDDPQAHTLDQRRRAALSEVDSAEFSWFHVKVIFVAGVGFFTDAYDIFAITIAATMLGLVYGTPDETNGFRALKPSQDLLLKIATPLGSIIGQVFFGWLADQLGRKRMYGFELITIVAGTFSQALAGQGPAVNIIYVLSVWRFIMGIGIGGDYPLSAVISSEFSATRIRGRVMTAVFASQGWGNLVASLVSLVVVNAFKKAVLNDGPDTNHIDFMWRLLIGLGSVPGAIALYFRFTIPESPRFTMDIERSVLKASEDVDLYLLKGSSLEIDPDAPYPLANMPKASRNDFRAYFSKKENFKVLLGTCLAWFCQDFAFYGLGLNSSVIFNAITVFINTDKLCSSDGSSLSNSAADPTDIVKALQNISILTLIISAAGLLPGYYATFLFIDKWGRIPIQKMGFAVLTLLFILMGALYSIFVPKETVNTSALNGIFFLYCLANFFQNFGPNSTTFIIPGEAFPTRYRSTAHGLSAASGRLGAILAQIGLYALENRNNNNDCRPSFITEIWLVFALFMFTGFLATTLIPETMGRSLEDISNEEQTGFVRGVNQTNTIELSTSKKRHSVLKFQK